MTGPTRIRATEKDGVIDVRILMKHDMETGQRKTPEGTVVPAWFISTVEAKVGDKIVYSAQFGTAISKDPFLHFKLKGVAKKGEAITVAWMDNKGTTRTDKVDIT